MISSATITALEQRGLADVLGVRERNDKLLHQLVLEAETPFTPLLIARQPGETRLFVKAVMLKAPEGKQRYLVARNEAEKD